jgi:hypothetical protein
VIHLAAHQCHRPNGIVATGFMPGSSADGDAIAGSTRSPPNNPNSRNQDLVAWRLCESHLRGIRTPTDSHSIVSKSHESVKPTKLEARDRGINPLAT